ncbi:VENN motif pre-toxin domain-containing protein [Pararhodobacter oceanensis]
MASEKQRSVVWAVSTLLGASLAGVRGSV